MRAALERSSCTLACTVGGYADCLLCLGVLVTGTSVFAIRDVCRALISVRKLSKTRVTYGWSLLHQGRQPASDLAQEQVEDNKVT